MSGHFSILIISTGIISPVHQLQNCNYAVKCVLYVLGTWELEEELSWVFDDQWKWWATIGDSGPARFWNSNEKKVWASWAVWDILWSVDKISLYDNSHHHSIHGLLVVYNGSWISLGYQYPIQFWFPLTMLTWCLQGPSISCRSWMPKCISIFRHDLRRDSYTAVFTGTCRPKIFAGVVRIFEVFYGCLYCGVLFGETDIRSTRKFWI